MTRKILEGIRRFQEHLLEIGVARSVLALPASRMLSLPSPTTAGAEPAGVFARLISEIEIKSVSADLFASGYYNLAVSEAFKAVDKYISKRCPDLDHSGTTLMDQVFSPTSPFLKWSERKTNSEKDEHKGYHRLYSGAMLGIRNPTIHEFDWIDDPEVAIELIVFANHLIKKAKLAHDVSN